MKWLVMMSPEQLPRAAPAVSGKRRGVKKTAEERTLEVTARGSCEMFCRPPSAHPHSLHHVAKKDAQAKPVIQHSQKIICPPQHLKGFLV